MLRCDHGLCMKQCSTVESCAMCTYVHSLKTKLLTSQDFKTEFETDENSPAPTA
jgi:hypothetical protein